VPASEQLETKQRMGNNAAQSSHIRTVGALAGIGSGELVSLLLSNYIF
jgi:hypothetical protein